VFGCAVGSHVSDIDSMSERAIFTSAGPSFACGRRDRRDRAARRARASP
jgi:hypothetical protein